MSFDFDNNVPIYLQLVEQIERDIISGKIAAGERLPSVRDLALQLKVNPNTVQKALVELEEKGLIFTERTNGRFVTDDSLKIERHKQRYADKITRKYMDMMVKIGFDKNEVLRIVEERGGNK